MVDKKGKTSIGRAYAKVIENASAKELKPFFEQKIDKDSKVTTDGLERITGLYKKIGQ